MDIEDPNKGRELLRMQADIEKAEEFSKLVQEALISKPSLGNKLERYKKETKVLIRNKGNIPAIVKDFGAGMYLVHKGKKDGTHEPEICTEDDLMSIN